MQLIPITEMAVMAEAIAKSGLFGIRTADQALALGLLCQAEGRHPAEAARDYHVIQGRPTLKADAMLARFQNAGGRVEWTAYTDESVTGVFSHPQGGTLTLTWDVERAKKAGLMTRDTWKQYTRQMLRARVISEAIRTVLPGVLSGCYTDDEIRSIPSETVPVYVKTTPLQLAPAYDHATALANVETATTLEELRIAWTAALADCQRSGTPEELAELTAAKDTKKSNL
jgi:hypothetical protein